jgi:hypothetical protein
MASRCSTSYLRGVASSPMERGGVHGLDRPPVIDHRAIYTRCRSTRAKTLTPNYSKHCFSICLVSTFFVDSCSCVSAGAVTRRLPSTGSSLLARASHSTFLSLSSCTFDNFTNVRSVVASFPFLTQLAVVPLKFLHQPSHLTPDLDVADLPQQTIPKHP